MVPGTHLRDGAYTFEHAKAQFHRVPASSPAELHQLLDPLIVRIIRALARGAVLIEEPEHPYLDLEPNSRLDQLSVATVRYRIAAEKPFRVDSSGPFRQIATTILLKRSDESTRNGFP